MGNSKWLWSALIAAAMGVALVGAISMFTSSPNRGDRRSGSVGENARNSAAISGSPATQKPVIADSVPLPVDQESGAAIESASSDGSPSRESRDDSVRQWASGDAAVPPTMAGDDERRVRSNARTVRSEMPQALPIYPDASGVGSEVPPAIAAELAKPTPDTPPEILAALAAVENLETSLEVQRVIDDARYLRVPPQIQSAIEAAPALETPPEIQAAIDAAQSRAKTSQDSPLAR